MKLAVASLFDPFDAQSWSGCSAFLLDALAKVRPWQIDPVGPLRRNPSLADRIRRKYFHARGKSFLPEILPHHLKAYAELTGRYLRETQPDCILALDAHAIAYLETDRPIFYFWDCTFEGNLEYPYFARLAPPCIAAGHEMERLALQRATRAFYSANWALRSARERYGMPADRLALIPLAANLHCDRTALDVARLIEARPSDRVELLFLGVDWFRKGGDLALGVTAELNRRGLPARLTVAGCAPETNGDLPTYVEPRGFLRKSDPAELAQLDALIARSHFLIVPSLAESFGAVFCEANSFGTPALARRVGGTDSAIENGVNGMLFEPDAGPAAYADFIGSTMRDYGAYRALAHSSFDRFQTQGTWAYPARLLAEEIEGTMQAARFARV